MRLADILMFLAIAWLFGACGPHIDPPSPVTPSQLTGVACEVVPIPGSDRTYDGVKCKEANEVARGLEGIDPARISCFKAMAVNCKGAK